MTAPAILPPFELLLLGVDGEVETASKADVVTVPKDVWYIVLLFETVIVVVMP
jgi:hypothetical protein